MSSVLHVWSHAYMRTLGEGLGPSSRGRKGVGSDPGKGQVREGQPSQLHEELGFSSVLSGSSSEKPVSTPSEV